MIALDPASTTAPAVAGAPAARAPRAAAFGDVLQQLMGRLAGGAHADGGAAAPTAGRKPAPGQRGDEEPETAHADGQAEADEGQALLAFLVAPPATIAAAPPARWQVPDAAGAATPAASRGETAAQVPGAAPVDGQAASSAVPAAPWPPFAGAGAPRPRPVDGKPGIPAAAPGTPPPDPAAAVIGQPAGGEHTAAGAPGPATAGAPAPAARTAGAPADAVPRAAHAGARISAELAPPAQPPLPDAQAPAAAADVTAAAAPPPHDRTSDRALDQALDRALESAPDRPDASPAPALNPHLLSRLAQAAASLEPVSAAVGSSAGAPAPAAPAMTAAPPDEIVAPQIVQSMRLLAADGGGEARVRLKPEYLGEVLIVVKVEQGGVTAALQAESPAVRQWAEAHESVLRESLGGHGLRLEQLTVSPETPRPPSPDRQAQDHPADPRGRPQPRRRRAGADAGAERFEVVL